jgi:polyisoprenyl-teichoic acid--peptidoglycan teichoic acid transferase
MGKPNKINKKVKIFLIVSGILLFILSGTVIGVRMYIKNKLSAIKTVDLPKTAIELGIDEGKYIQPDNVKKPNKSSNDIVNILLLGIDSTDSRYYRGRSDSMIVLTIDKMHKKLKLTSIMRDSLVSIEGYGEDKIGHANAYGDKP